MQAYHKTKPLEAKQPQSTTRSLKAIMSTFHKDLRKQSPSIPIYELYSENQ